MRNRTLPILVALVLAVFALPILAAEDPQAPYQKPAMEQPQPPALQQEDPATPVTQPADPLATTPPVTQSTTTTTEDVNADQDSTTQTTTTTTTTTTPTDTSTTTTATPDDEGLPQTASPLALLALLGVGGAGTAFGLRKARRH